jgi:excisionase family DNA binding protein
LSDNPLTNTLTLFDVADTLACSVMTARRLVKAGELPAVTWRGKYYIKRADLAQYIRKAVTVYRAEKAPTRAQASA